MYEIHGNKSKKDSLALCTEEMILDGRRRSRTHIMYCYPTGQFKVLDIIIEPAFGI